MTLPPVKKTIFLAFYGLTALALGWTLRAPGNAKEAKREPIIDLTQPIHITKTGGKTPEGAEYIPHTMIVHNQSKAQKIVKLRDQEVDESNNYLIHIGDTIVAASKAHSP